MTTVLSLENARARLAPDSTVLLLIDPQVGPLWDLEFSRLRKSLSALAGIAARVHMPTVVSTFTPERWGPVISGVPTSPPPIERMVVNAWDDIEVRSAIAAHGPRSLIVAGGAPGVSVVPCALSASRAGYEVYAVADLSTEANQHGIVRMFRAGIIVADPALLLAELDGPRVAARGGGAPFLRSMSS